ncbi:extracellular solute-binding protein [Nakamurella sp. YIM 132087]|uniref:Extracellular solute-binding protein n=1 Tax=Nakamurella alba TaxID=2665158 RepID=A0A7K1FST6_9ACTN|nr:extracellular solute-binding protein [Nakamurella alba]MTD17188.1 extracellular solute-binding protein [Nakamurella alba]
MTAITRRTAFKLLGAGAAAALTGPWLAGCGGSGGDRAAIGNAGTSQAPWPTYTAAEVPPPDLVSKVSGGLNGYFTYPDKLVTSVASAPGDGSAVTATLMTYSPPPAPVGQNKLWTAINEAMNADIRMNLVPAAEYQNKLATIMAGGELTDMMLVTAAPRIREFVASQCADLTEFLSGDAIKDYPNLANLPTYAWQAMGRIGGKIYGIPIVRARMTNVLHVNRDHLDAVGATDDWTMEQFATAVAEERGGSFYPLGTFDSEWLVKNYFAGALGAPNQWAVDGGGAFSSTYATPEFRAAIEMSRKAFADGLFHPASVTAGQSDMFNEYYAGNVGALSGSFANYFNGTYQGRIGDTFTTDVGFPFSPGQTSWLFGGLFGYVVFKKSDPERLKMLLRIADFAAAPYGSKENELLNYGVEGVHFTRTANGPEPTKLAETESANTVPIGKYLGDAPDVIQCPGDKAVTQRAFDVQEALQPKGLVDPSLGLASATQDQKGVALNKAVSDAISAIVTGRADMSSWDAAVSAFRSGGGDTIATELATEYSAAQSSS